MESGNKYAFVDEANRKVSQHFDSIDTAFGYLPKQTRVTLMEINAMRFLNEEESARWMTLWNTQTQIS